MKIILIIAQWDRCERISSKFLYCNDIIILNVFINEQRNHRTYSFIANIILQNDQNVCVFHKKSKSIIWFITIDAFTFTNDLLANLNRFIELRCNVFFMFFEFIIALFAHELLSRRLVMLFFDSIRREIDENSREMFDFKRSFFFSWFWSFFISKKRLSSSWSKSWTMLLTNWWRIETRWERFATRSRNIIACESVEHVLSSVFSFDAFCTSTIMRCAHDFRTFRTFYIFQWSMNRIR